MPPGDPRLYCTAPMAPTDLLSIDEGISAMSTALLSRSAVVSIYLLALLLNGRADLLTGSLAAAVVAVWVISLLRDRLTRRGPVPAPQSRSR
jgi:hypothetical protein